jgi:hypothetical protein
MIEMSMESKKPSAAGKGDDSRITDYKSYFRNFDDIDWREKGTFCEDCGNEGPKVKSGKCQGDCNCN